ncbi:hypothetical protein ANN_03965 [Periplaneta americana]|uniref:DUF659 domain-containing protein n=1 Tax=Periplaneta americana TaxID=6978 RepID=A0ABQ8T799_PERAM|nr:hypothetical protein ANN_03965 [Periplaneta americana]
MCKFAQVLEDVPLGEVDGVCVCDIPLFKYARLTSCDVERSFSQYKSLFRDNRHAFVMENLEMTFVVHCNSRPTTSTQVWLRRVVVLIRSPAALPALCIAIRRTDYQVGELITKTAAKEAYDRGTCCRPPSFRNWLDGFQLGRIIFSDETTIPSDVESRSNVYPEPGTRCDRCYPISNDARGREDLACHAGLDVSRWYWHPREHRWTIWAPPYLHINVGKRASSISPS